MTTPDPAAWARDLRGPVTFQGDAHGKLVRLARPGHPVVQVGDLGAGFVSASDFRQNVSDRGDFRFIRGNHDDPAICRKDPRYLGYLKKTRFRCLAELETLKVEFDGDGGFSW